MGAVLPGGALIHQLQIGLVNESCGRDRLAGAPVPELPARHGAELVIDQGDQPMRSAAIPLTRCGKKAGDLS